MNLIAKLLLLSLDSNVEQRSDPAARLCALLVLQQDMNHSPAPSSTTPALVSLAMCSLNQNMGSPVPTVHLAMVGKTEAKKKKKLFSNLKQSIHAHLAGFPLLHHCKQ